MEKADRDKTKYLTFKDIKGAFHKEKFELSTKQVEELLSDIKQNRHKEYNYHILLCSLFGDNYKNEINIESKSVRTTPKFAQPKSLKKGDRKSRTRKDDISRSKSRVKDDKSSDGRSSGKSSGRSRGRSSGRSRGRDSRRSKSRLKDSERKSRHKHSDKTHSKKRSPTSRSKSKHHSRSKPRKSSRSRRRSDSEESRSRTRKSRDHRRETSKSDRKDRSKSKKGSGKTAKYIGKKLVSSKYNYINHLK